MGTPISLAGFPEGFETSVPPEGWSKVVAPWEGGFLQRILHIYGDLGAVDRFDAANGTPSLAELQSYDVVLTWSFDPYADPTALGNVLADYVEVGGKVINLDYSLINYSGYYLAGRFLEGNYVAMWESSGYSDGTLCLGTFDSTHQIMKGISVLPSF
jgi:hypothetical protein